MGPLFFVLERNDLKASSIVGMVRRKCCGVDGESHFYKESNGPFDLRSSNTRDYSEIESHQASHEVVSPSHAR